MKKKLPSKRVKRKSFIQPNQWDLGLHDSSANRIPKAAFGAYDKYLQAYADESWVYSCVSRRALDVAASPICLYNKHSLKKVEEHPVLDLLAKPNSEMNRHLLIEWVISSLQLAGSCYLKYDQVDGVGRPRTIWPLIPSLVEVVPGPDAAQAKLGYLYHVGGQRIPYGIEEVKQLKLFNPTSYLYGLPPLSAARISVDTHRASSVYNLAFFDNSARPDMVFETPHSLQPEQRKRMWASIMQAHRGEKKGHGVMFLEKGTVAKILGVNHKDMDFILQKKMSREEMCSVFKVPPAIVGLFEYANYANSKEQDQIYHRGTIVPDAMMVCEFFNENLLPLFDPSGSLHFALDLSQIKALQEDEAARSSYVDKYWRMGVPLNQMVKSFGLPFGEVKGIGDLSFINGTVVDEDGVAVGATAPEEDVELQDEEEEKPEPKKVADLPAQDKGKPSKAQIKAKHNRFLLLADRLSEPFRKDMRAFFDGQRDRVLKALREGNPPELNLNGLGLNVIEEANKLKPVLLPHLRKGVVAGRKSENVFIEDLLKKAAPEASVKADERVSRWLERNAFSWAEDINATTLKKLSKVLDEGLAEGESIDQLSKRVAEVFDVERDYRTLRIAQTEVIAALNEGALEAYRDNEQIEGKGWLATGDEVTRDTHVEAGRKYSDKGAIAVDDNFTVGSGAGPAPGQIGQPEEDINCRCSVFPVVKKA